MEQLESTGTEQFFERHHRTLGQIGSIVGLPTNFTSSLDQAVSLTQPWVAGDHTRSQMDISISEAQSAELRPLFDDLGLSRVTVLDKRDYDHILVPGAVQLGNNGRIKFLKETIEQGGVSAGDIVLLGGQRKVFGEVESHLLSEDLRSVHEQGIQDDWIDALANQIENLTWETDFMRLAAIKHLGALPLRRLHLRVIGPDTRPPYDAVKQYEFSWRDIPLRLMHTLATQRPNGEARHTTESCVKEWVAAAEPAAGAVVGFIASNPHRDRMAKSCRRALITSGRPDITLIAAGPANAEGIGDKIFLGELARNLYEDTLLG